MLKVLETTSNRLIIKEKRSICDVTMLVVFLFVTVYFLLISTLEMWAKIGVKKSLLDFIYRSLTYSPLAYFIGICLLLFPAAFGLLLTFGSWFPTRIFTFDRKRNRLTIKFNCFCWHYAPEYSLDEIQTLRWFPQPVYAGGMTMVDVQFLKLVRRKQNGKIHLIPIRYTSHSETNTVVNLIHRFLMSKN